MTWLAIAMRYWKLGVLALVLAFAGWQYVRAERLSDKLATVRVERDAALRDIKRLIDESNRRKEAGKRAIEADKPKAEARAKARTIIQYRESECETPPDIIEALDKGWQR